MDMKEFWYKLMKGAVTGAISSLTAISLVGVPSEKYLWAIVGAALSGALHGASNALEQKKRD